jgi:molybdenum cofactor cytidylyltransferase
MKQRSAKIVAVVPAAGHSTRMGRPKLALSFGDRTVLEHVVSALLAGGVEHVVVVIGPHVAELQALAEAAGAKVHTLPATTPDMRSTIELGLRYLAERYVLEPHDAFLLAPGDRPGFTADIVCQLYDAYLSPRSSSSIVIPTYGTCRAHPSLIAWKHVAGILALPYDLGVNAFFHKNAEVVEELPVTDGRVLLNLDTPDDYDVLQRSGPSLGF